MSKKTYQDVRDKSRRKVIQSLGISSGVLATNAFIPEKWTKPIVESAMLPAHAQTSGDDDDDDDDSCRTLSISGFTLTCGDSLSLVNRTWSIIDDANGCGQFTTGDPVETSGGTPSLSANQFTMQLRSAGDRVLFLATSTGDSSAVWPNSNGCPGTASGPTTFMSQVTSTPGGRVYTVTATATFTTTSSQISNITFTPI